MSINISSPNGVHADNTTAVAETDDATVLALPMLPPLPGQPGTPYAHASVDLPVAAEAAWPVLSDLSRLGRWLTIHDEWHSELPTELAAGAELTQQITLAGWSGAITWTVDECRAPSLLRLTGIGLTDVVVTLELTVQPIGYWSRVVAELEFTGRAAKGAAGIVLELGGSRELRASLANLERLVGP